MSQNIKDIKLDEKTSGPWTPETDHDLKIAIYDLLEKNYFRLLDSEENNFRLIFKLDENQLTLEVFSLDNEINLRSIIVNVKKLRKLLREYIILCDSYFTAIKSAPISKVEAIDVGRRSLHDQASEELIEKCGNYIDMDLNTARRFVTLISIIQRKALPGMDFY